MRRRPRSTRSRAAAGRAGGARTISPPRRPRRSPSDQARRRWHPRPRAPRWSVRAGAGGGRDPARSARRPTGWRTPGGDPTPGCRGARLAGRRNRPGGGATTTAPRAASGQQAAPARAPAPEAPRGPLAAPRARHRGRRSPRRTDAPAGRRAPARPGHRGGLARGRPDRRGRGRGRQQPTERPDVLVVVPDHGREGLGRAAAQEPEVPPGDLPAVDVVVALDAEEHPLDRAQAGVVHPVTEQAAHGREEIQVAGMEREPPGGRAGSGSPGAASRTPDRCT